MAFRKGCPRTLDRPIVLFGLEPEELVAVGLLAGLILFAVDPVPAVGVGAVLWVGLARLKAGRPPGYLYEQAYRTGLLHRAPEFLRVPHLIPRGVRYLDPFPGIDDESARRYWGDRPRLDS
jgi:type IV secretory pathway TrbD component